MIFLQIVIFFLNFLKLQFKKFLFSAPVSWCCECRCRLPGGPSVSSGSPLPRLSHPDRETSCVFSLQPGSECITPCFLPTVLLDTVCAVRAPTAWVWMPHPLPWGPAQSLV